MSGLQMAFAIVLIVVSLVMNIVISLQKNREANASGVTGTSAAEMNNNNFFDKSGAHAKDNTLAKSTKVLGVLWAAISLACVLVILFVK